MFGITGSCDGSFRHCAPRKGRCVCVAFSVYVRYALEPIRGLILHAEIVWMSLHLQEREDDNPRRARGASSWRREACPPSRLAIKETRRGGWRGPCLANLQWCSPAATNAVGRRDIFAELNRGALSWQVRAQVSRELRSVPGSNTREWEILTSESLV